jgi:4-hydroxybenzoyl-CoA reductase subunit beta
MIALGAEVTLVAPEGERRLPVRDLYGPDGIAYLAKRAHEVLTHVHVPDRAGWRTTYRKLRRRGSIDFAALTVAAAVWSDEGGVIERAAIWLGSVASSPLRVAEAEILLAGRRLDDETIEEAARLCRRAATPLDNADFTAQWRSRMVERWAADTLRACAERS